MTEEEAFKAGWEAGMFDGGEHDCRMFEPTADRAWKHFQFVRERDEKLRRDKAIVNSKRHRAIP